MTGYRKWKLLLTTKLIEIYKNTDDPELKKKIMKMINKVQYVKLKELSSFIRDLFQLSQHYQELKELIPDMETVKSWMEEYQRIYSYYKRIK